MSDCDGVIWKESFFRHRLHFPSYESETVVLFFFFCHGSYTASIFDSLMNWLQWAIIVTFPPVSLSFTVGFIQLNCHAAICYLDEVHTLEIFKVIGHLRRAVRLKCLWRMFQKGSRRPSGLKFQWGWSGQPRPSDMFNMIQFHLAYGSIIPKIITRPHGNTATFVTVKYTWICR